MAVSQRRKGNDEQCSDYWQATGKLMVLESQTESQRSTGIGPPMWGTNKKKVVWTTTGKTCRRTGEAVKEETTRLLDDVTSIPMLRSQNMVWSSYCLYILPLWTFLLMAILSQFAVALETKQTKSEPEGFTNKVKLRLILKSSFKNIFFLSALNICVFIFFKQAL